MNAITTSPDFTNKVYIKDKATDEVYTKTAADATLVSKFTNDDAFKTQIIEQTLEDSEFQNAVRKVMSQPVFDIPTDSSAPISVDW